MSKKTARVLATVVILGGAFITLLATSLREIRSISRMSTR